jgi:hypothetical protein
MDYKIKNNMNTDMEKGRGLRVLISATLFRRAVLVLWRAFLFLGLRFFHLFLVLLGGLHCLFPCKNLFFMEKGRENQRKTNKR